MATMNGYGNHGGGREQSERGIEDMILLDVLDERTILENLQTRYGNNHIYTYCGSILVSVNPYQMFNIYGLDMVKRYEGQPIGSLPPHLFAIASTSYGRMMKNTENQVIVISGESGSGKTEATKLIMQYLAAVNTSGTSTITEQILEANPLLESFGNAKTIRNDNSSRFGKYIEVFFKSGAIVGARTSEYLLEKSRIVTQAPDERNYHVFYEMLAGISEERKKRLGVTTAEKYFYLNQGGSCSLSSRNDAENYRMLCDALQVLNFSKHEDETIHKILASVLHCGNIFFKRVTVDNHDTVTMGSSGEVKWITHLLELSEDWLKQALTQKVTETRGDKILTPYNIDQALDSRDAISKALYSRLFTWLVERINLTVSHERDKSSSLAVLDIFGFEDFHVNSLEQLCINYANETLQFFFNQHVFRLEQKEYAKEKIEWTNIDFQDNQPVIDLIASKPAGILHILDDECNFPQATDSSFLEKCHFHHSDNGLYGKPRMSHPEFFIKHYAGKIKYSIVHFLEKNKDTLRSDVVELLCESKNKMIAQMFKDMRDRLITKTLSKTTGRFVTMKPRTPTVAASFSESLLSLIETMSRCNPYFVRCVKPNNNKAAMTFENGVVLDQLRYTGMLETIRIRKLGFPVRVKFHHFIERYRCLLRGEKIHVTHLPTDVCLMILKTQPADLRPLCRIGATKVFMKEKLEQQLDLEARKLHTRATQHIQKFMRMYLARRKFRQYIERAHRVQAAIKMHLARKRYIAVHNGIIRAQAQFRMHRQHKKYLKNREEIKRKLEQEHIAKQQEKARQKLEMERREKLLRAEASIKNLDIPGELAFVYNKLDDWRPVHSDRHIISVIGDVVPMEFNYRLPSDVNSHAFSKYVNAYFKSPEWGVQVEPINSALTHVQGEQNNRLALAVNKLILKYMYDQTLGDKKEKAMADYIVQLGLQNEGLRDEIYCQLVNQTWRNQKLMPAERGWQLMAHCLAAFPPSQHLYKFLLKYVSDVGMGGYKWFCQHKALQCGSIEPQLCRIYPPCLLEWRAAQRKANMALEVRFADNATMIGHVESWTLGEDFCKHLLNLRGLRDNNKGWTVVLQEDRDYYELMGYDYVFDLISEMEISPGFPVCRSYFLVSSDRSREPHSMQRALYSESPHNPERERHMVMVGKLPEPLKIDITKIEQRSIKQRTVNGEVSDGGGVEFSMTSVLNKRPQGVNVDGLSDSKMNLRYTKRKAAPSPPIGNGYAVTNGNGYSNGDIDTSRDLSQTQLNRRYNNVIHEEDISPTKINQRYLRMTKASAHHGGAADKIARKTQRDVDNVSVGTGHSDWSHWVEDVFSNALNEHVDGLSDARSVENRLKGGGDGIPQPQYQQGAVGMQINGGINIPLQHQMPVPMMNGGLPTLNLSNPGLQPQMVAQSLTQQQMVAQQQAMMQAYAQAQAQAQAQQQQQALLQAYQQQQQQQQQQQAQQTSQAQYATSLQQQQLAQLLQQQRLLEAALQQQQQMQRPSQAVMHPVMAPSSVNASFSMPQASGAFFPNESTQSTFSSQGMQARMTAPVPVVNSQSTVVKQGPVTFQTVEHTDTTNGGARRVIKFRQHFEKETVSASQPQERVVSPVHAPPPPPMQFQDTPRMAPAPPAPPPPPPIPEHPQLYDKEKGTYTFKDKKGRARTVRIGRVVWPPPPEKEEKLQREVGRLEIDEKVQRELDERMRPTQPQKVETPRVEPKKEPPKKKQQLAETVHLATLQLLEQKIAPKPAPQKPPTPPPPRIETPPPAPKIQHAKQTQVIVETHTQTEVPQPPEPEVIDYRSLEMVNTELHRQNKDTFLTYSNVPWTLHVRKEVFVPGERLENPLALHLIYCQVVQDVYNNGCIRISKDDRIKMRGMLESHGINAGNYLSGSFKNQVKRIVVDTAKEWPTYFCRLFPVASSGHLAGVHYVGVSHSGIYFVQRIKSLVEDYLDVIEHIKFEDVVDVVMPSRTSIQISTKNKSYVFYTKRAQQMKDMIDQYLHASDMSNKFVVATKDYITRESTLLSFKRGDVIKLMDADVDDAHRKRGWLYGTLNGVVGYFPAEMIRPLARHEVEVARSNQGQSLALDRTSSFRSLPPPAPVAHVSETTVQRVIHKSHNNNRDTSRELVQNGPVLREALPAPDNHSETSQGTHVPDGKFSMMEFALLHFRESIEKYDISRPSDGSMYGTIKSIEKFKLHNLHKQEHRKRKGSGDWTWKEQAEMVKWTRSPIQTSMLKLEGADLNKMATECFICIMKFMGDYPMASNQNEIDCALKVLRYCHKYPELRDEVYCQLCKQTTNNRSMKPKSCIMGWRLFAIVAAYCDCSESFRPYLFKYLETTASDMQRTYSGAAGICLQNLRKTFKYGGRKNVPLKEEINALANGRISKRFTFLYSGSEREGVVHIKPCTVVRDCVEDICSRIDIQDAVEVDEYTVFLRTRSGTFSRLRNEEYILDVTTELLRTSTEYDLVFQRTVWYFPFKVSDNLFYNELMYFQCFPDYVDGLLVMTKNGTLNKQYERDIQFLAALLHRASDHVNMPTIRELEHLVPEIVRALPGYSGQQWLNRVHDEMKEVMRRTPPECMAKFVEVLSNWPLFGSTFFRVKKILIQPEFGECILAVNQSGIMFLDPRSHDIVLQYTFSDVLSTRRYRSDSNQNYLDMKLGNLMVQKIVRIETEQGSDISNLIGQYMQVINRHRKRPSDKGGVTAPYQTPRDHTY
ncbi:unconventional myosin-XV-like isoform X3 [Dreissena polymorpha]|uniref:unconventional myosin-XV-like isoform X3 n=1 Tax=Dreissena polymorpha TaxID=45954 RepID=UPI002264B3A1|nr:unconventional myosin-XV-like isoform X3 [Dreissena polymorpha]